MVVRVVVVMVMVVVVVVAVVAVVVVMSDDKAGSWGLSIIYLLSTLFHKNSYQRDRWTIGPRDRQTLL